MVTDAADRGRIPGGLAETVLVVDGGLAHEMADAPAGFETVDTAADAPARLYCSPGATGTAKGHRHQDAHREVPADRVA